MLQTEIEQKNPTAPQRTIAESYLEMRLAETNLYSMMRARFSERFCFYLNHPFEEDDSLGDFAKRVDKL
jgi:hypothetical protein